MSGLVLKLGPRERVLVNGVVVENGDRRTKLHILTRNANILRLRDALHPEDVKTPVSRVCYILQLMLSGETSFDAGRLQALRGVEQLQAALTDAKSTAWLESAKAQLRDGNVYTALKSLRRLLPVEAVLLKNAQT